MTKGKIQDEEAAGQKLRLNLEIAPHIKEQLRELEQRTSASSLTEVFRRALALYDMLTEHVQKGGAIIFRNPDGTEERVRIL